MFVQTNLTDHEYPLNFCKIRNSDTIFIETSLGDRNINHGVFIDVFPLDFYPNAPLSIALTRLKNQILLIRISEIYRVPVNTFPKKIKRVLAKIFAMFMPLEKTIQSREKLMKSKSNGRKIANYCGAWGEKEIVPKEWYGEGSLLEFEGLWLNAPKEYDKWLTQVYGDYMKLPPAEKQVTHHYTDIIDLDNSYTKYMGNTKS